MEADSIDSIEGMDDSEAKDRIFPHFAQQSLLLRLYSIRNHTVIEYPPHVLRADIARAIDQSDCNVLLGHVNTLFD